MLSANSPDIHQHVVQILMLSINFTSFNLKTVNFLSSLSSVQGWVPQLQPERCRVKFLPMNL